MLKQGQVYSFLLKALIKIKVKYGCKIVIRCSSINLKMGKLR